MQFAQKKFNFSQDEYLKVKISVVNPLTEYYHQEINEKMINAIVEDLKEFSTEILEEVMIILRRKSNKVPSTQQIINESRALQKKKSPQPNPYESRDRNSVDKKVAKAYNICRSYLAYWRTSPDAMKASEEGWFDEADCYVREVANLQAHWIVGLHNAGYSCTVCFPHINVHSPSDQKIMDDFFLVQSVQAQVGEIKVTFPPGLIVYWKNKQEEIKRRLLGARDDGRPITALLPPKKSFLETSMEFMQGILD